MKSAQLSAILIALVTLPVYGQYSCSPVERSGFTGGSISLQAGQNIAGTSTLTSAEEYWTGQCGNSGTIPNFFVNNTNADLQITVDYHFGVGPKCGTTTWGTPFAGAAERPVAINLYEAAVNDNGVVASCAPYDDALAHEIGHVLGIGDAPNPGTLCRGEIMGGRASGERRSVMSGDCATADQNWYTPTERHLDEQNSLLQDCESRCASHCEQEYGGGGFYCPVEGQSPIIFDLDDNGFNLTDADHGVDFDLNADHRRERIAWTSAAGSDAWLCRDRSGNGVIDDGRELFGNFTPLANGRKAPNGFVALAEFDTPALGGNGDGQLDSRDQLWGTLLLWIDVNHDGISQPSELMTLAEAGVQSIDLHYIRSNYTDNNGNIFRFRTKALVRSPNGKLHNAKIYDVFLSTSVTGSSGVP